MNNENTNGKILTDEELREVAGGSGSTLPDVIICPVCKIGHALGGVMTENDEGIPVLRLGCGNPACDCVFEVYMDGTPTGRAWKNRKPIQI